MEGSIAPNGPKKKTTSVSAHAEALAYIRMGSYGKMFYSLKLDANGARLQLWFLSLSDDIPN